MNCNITVIPATESDRLCERGMRRVLDKVGAVYGRHI